MPRIYDNKKLKKDIQNIVEKERLFRDVALSREMVAEAVGCTRKKISEVMAEEFGCSFPLYINKVRAMYVRSMLRKGAFRGMNMDEIAAQAGFASRKSLHLAYRRLYGVAISDARKEFE